MLRIEEFRPHFQFFTEYLINRKAEATGGQEFEAHAAQFQKFLGGLRERIAWEFPLVTGFSEAQHIDSDFQELSEETLRLLKESEPGPELAQNVEDVHLLAEALRRYQEHLPKFTDVQVLNEILVLAAIQEPSTTDLRLGALKARLKPATAWVFDTECSWRLFEASNPGTALLAKGGFQALAGIKGALGGLYESLSEETHTPDLTTPCEVLVEALTALAKCEKDRFHLETESSAHRNNIHLTRVRRALAQGAPFPLEGVAELHRFYTERSRTLESLRLQCLCQEWSQDQVQALKARLGEFTELGLVWRSMSRVLPPDIEELSELMNRLERWESLFQEFSVPDAADAPIDASGFEEIVLTKS